MSVATPTGMTRVRERADRGRCALHQEPLVNMNFPLDFRGRGLGLRATDTDGRGAHRWREDG